VTFVVSKDAKDTLRRIQRQLRDFFSARAEELHRSTSQALDAATKAVKSDEATRKNRLKDVDAELTRIGRLRQRAIDLDAQVRKAAKSGAPRGGAPAGAGAGPGGAQGAVRGQGGGRA